LLKIKLYSSETLKCPHVQFFALGDLDLPVPVTPLLKEEGRKSPSQQDGFPDPRRGVPILEVTTKVKICPMNTEPWQTEAKLRDGRKREMRVSLGGRRRRDGYQESPEGPLRQASEAGACETGLGQVQLCT
jgi:hypothetical protein